MTETIHTPTRPRRWHHRAGAILGLGAALLLGLSTVAPVSPVAADGPGPQWTNWWTGNGNMSEGPHAGGVWTGTPAYESFPGGTDGNDQGFSFDGTNFVSGPPALGNFGTDDFRINVRVQTTQSDTDQHDLISTRAACVGAPYWQVFVDGSGRLSITLHGTDGVATNLTNPTPINDGGLTGVNIWRSGGTLSIEVGGGATVSTAINGTGDFTTVDQHVRLGGGNPCLGAGILEPFVGLVDHLLIEQGNDPSGQDLLLEQASTPVVPAGGSGSLVVNRINDSESHTDLARATFTAPPGITFTGASDPNGVCTLTDASTVTCRDTDYGSTGNNPVTIAFDVAASATPGSTVNVTGDFTNLSNTDPDHANDQDIPLAIDIAPEAGIPLVDPTVAGVAAGLVALGGVGLVLRRRSQA